MKKGRHRRFEEARALKRSHEVDLEDLFESISDEDATEGEHKPEHDAWADLAEEWESKNTDDAVDGTDAGTASADSGDAQSELSDEGSTSDGAPEPDDLSESEAAS